MGRGGRGAHAPLRRIVDLTGVLSATEKSDLIVLVTAITEKMYREINTLFDSPQIPPLEGEGPIRNWLTLALLQHESSEKENAIPPKSFANQPTASPTRKSSFPKDDAEEEYPSQLQELKKESIVFFRKWQSTLLQRLRDMAVTTIEEDITPRSRGRNARAAPRGGRGGRVGRGGRLNGHVPNGNSSTYRKCPDAE